MGPVGKVGIGMVVALILIWALPFGTILTWVLTLAVIGAPIAGWALLSPEQRRRIKRMRERGQLGRGR